MQIIILFICYLCPAARTNTNMLHRKIRTYIILYSGGVEWEQRRKLRFFFEIGKSQANNGTGYRDTIYTYICIGLEWIRMAFSKSLLGHSESCGN